MPAARTLACMLLPAKLQLYLTSAVQVLRQPSLLCPDLQLACQQQVRPSAYTLAYVSAVMLAYTIAPLLCVTSLFVQMQQQASLLWQAMQRGYQHQVSLSLVAGLCSLYSSLQRC